MILFFAMIAGLLIGVVLFIMADKFEMCGPHEGHALRGKGSAYVTDERGELVRPRYVWGVTGMGSAVCQCGAVSGFLTSWRRRKQWHREHIKRVARHR